MWRARTPAMLALGAWLAATATAGGADAPANARAGDPTRGAVLVASRSQGLCVLCHAVPGVPPSQHGTLGPDLAGAGLRWTAAQLRERLVDPERFNPGSLMPSYRRTDGLQRVAPARQGRPLFDAQQLEDVVAYLAALK